MKTDLSGVVFFIGKFNHFIYDKIGCYHPLFGKITIGLMYGSLLGVLFAYWGKQVASLILYGGGLLIVLSWLKIIDFNTATFNTMTGITSFSQCANAFQGIVDYFPIEFMSFIFFFLFFFIFMKRYYT